MADLRRSSKSGPSRDGTFLEQIRRRLRPDGAARLCLCPGNSGSSNSDAKCLEKVTSGAEKSLEIQLESPCGPTVVSAGTAEASQPTGGIDGCTSAIETRK